MTTNTFPNHIKNKSVVLVAPGSYMIGQNLGSFIDSHDVVCRIRRELSAEDYGEKTSAIFTHLRQKWNPWLYDQKNIDKINSQGIYICFPTPPSTTKNRRDLNNYKTKLKKHLSYNVEKNPLYAHMLANLQKNPTTGLRSIICLLGLQPKSITLAGFSFHQQFSFTGQKSLKDYCPEYFDKKIEKDTLDSFKKRKHNSDGEFKYFLEYVYNHSHVSIDPIMEKHMKTFL